MPRKVVKKRVEGLYPRAGHTLGDADLEPCWQLSSVGTGESKPAGGVPWLAHAAACEVVQRKHGAPHDDEPAKKNKKFHRKRSARSGMAPRKMAGLRADPGATSALPTALDRHRRGRVQCAGIGVRGSRNDRLGESFPNGAWRTPSGYTHVCTHTWLHMCHVICAVTGP